MWLELFYDLIYAVAVIELSSILESDLSLRGFLSFLAFFLPVWWVWLGFAVYSTRFDADDVAHRLLAFVQMLAIGIMAVLLHKHDFGSCIFAAAFVAARISLLLMYRRASALPHAAPVVRVYFIGFGSGALLWAASIFIPLPWRYALWAAGLFTDFVTPWIGRSRLQSLPLHPAHLPERLGTFASIVLYIAIESVVDGVGQVHATLKSVAAGLMSFVWAVCIWWIYTSIIEKNDLRRVLGSGQPYIYSHFLIVIGLSISSIGVRAAILGVDGVCFPRPISWLLGGGLACWLAAVAIIRQLILRDTRPACVGANLFAITCAIAFALAGSYVSPMTAMTFLTMLLGGLLSVELMVGVKGPH